MSNTIMSCAVWCEVHGPVNIFCTQTMDARAAANIVPTTTTNSSTASTTTSGPLDTGSKAGSSCASCSLTLPPHLSTTGLAPIIRTRDDPHRRTHDMDNNDDDDAEHDHDAVHSYVSMRHPTSPDRFKAVRSACIRALSCESVPGRSGPVFFGDPSIGYTIAYIFRIGGSGNSGGPGGTGGSSLSGRRQYALMCTATQESELLQSWTFITQRFKVLAAKIVEGSHVVERGGVAAAAAAAASQTTEVAQGMGGQQQQSVSMDRDRSFLRPKGRVSEKGLAELIGMEDIFVQLHAAFAWMLSVWRIHFEGQQQQQQQTVRSDNV